MLTVEELSPLLLRLALRAVLVLLVVWACKKLKPADTAYIDLAAEKRKRQASATGPGRVFQKPKDL